MEPLINCVVLCSGLLVPVLACWSIGCLFMGHSCKQCQVSQTTFFAVLLLISALTIRTVAVNDGHWLIHTSSLSLMIVAGVLKRPSAQDAIEFA